MLLDYSLHSSTVETDQLSSDWKHMVCIPLFHRE